jgi:primosomal protein N' (replication factor Y) (superfamily II helicase)
MEPGREYVHVAVDRPVDQLFTYRVPPSLRERIGPGLRVRVPFGRSAARGFVVGFCGPPPPGITAKSIDACLEDDPLVSDEIVRLLAWVGQYYGCSLGEALARCAPPATRKVLRSVMIKPGAPLEVMQEAIRGIAGRRPAQARILAACMGSSDGMSRSTLLRMTRASVASVRALVAAGLLRQVYEEEISLAAPPPAAAGGGGTPELTADQRAAVAEIEAAVSARAFAPFLLHGVTGSGKTEVYIRALERAVAEGGQGLVIVPEIALTPQTYARFAARLPGVVVLHSLLPAGERARNALAAKRGLVKVVIGARSAVFASFADLRIMVVDEEQETSFKAETAPRYHARDVAVMRAKLRGIPIVLGSATPSLETYQNALTGRYRLLILPRRVTPRGLPSVRLVDLTRAGRGASWLSEELVDLTANAMAGRKQAIFFLNRRGYARVVRCFRCGHVMSCPHCSVSLTYHHRGGFLQCHTCGGVTPQPESCPACAHRGLHYLGAGTERITSELKRRFPDVRVGRLDRDTATSRKSLLRILEEFGSGRLDILVGTQMLAKGHDFPDVTLVGIICAEEALHLPDFRAAERTFQLVHQVAGRAGRGEEPGIVIVQTFNPQNRVIQLAVAGDYRGFATEEISRRKPLGYPPFGRILRIVVRATKEAAAKEGAAAVREALAAARARVLGPAPCAVAKVRAFYRYQLLVKGAGHREIHAALARLAELRLPRSVEASADVDPVSFL